MVKRLLVAVCIVSFALLRPALAAGSAGDAIAGTYDILICKGACSFDEQANVVVKGQIVLFADVLGKSDLKRFDENRFFNHHGEPINGCFTLHSVAKSSTYAGIEKIGVTSWSRYRQQYSFSLFHSPDASYPVTVERTMVGFSGTGASWGGGLGPPEDPIKETVVARRTGDAAITNCTFQTDEEHELRRLLADPARANVLAIESASLKALLSSLQTSTMPRDWAMAGWLLDSEKGEGPILRAREAVPEDELIRWIAVDRTRVHAVPVMINGVVSGDMLQYNELDGSALKQLQRVEPDNAALWLMALRDAVDRHDEIATDVAMARLASSTYYDDHAAELLKAQLALFRSHPLPAAFFAAVAKLDPGWRVNGVFNKDAAPYYQNRYPFSDISIADPFFMLTDAGMHELYVVCVQQPGRSAARKDACVKIGRLLAERSRRVGVSSDGSMLLNDMNQFDDDDVVRARHQAWISTEFRKIHPHQGRGNRPFVQDNIAFVNDWIQSSDEFEAMRRAVIRAGKPLQPPEDFQLNRVAYGNFDKARERAAKAGGS